MTLLWVLLGVLLLVGVALAYLIRRGQLLERQAQSARGPEDQPRAISFFGMSSGIGVVEGSPATMALDLGGRLREAVSVGDMKAVFALVAGGADVNAAEPGSGNTPLILAAWFGHREAVRILVDSGADVRLASYDGSTPLTAAASAGEAEIARDLIAQGALVDATATDGSTPLMRASQEGHVEVIRVLCDSHASLELSARAGTALGLAAFCGHVEAVRALLEGGASVGGRALDGMTPLMRAAAGGQRQVLEMLIAHNAEVNARSASGLTALMLAAHSGHGDVASRLIELGARVDNVDDDFGASALLFAVDGGHPDAALRLLEAGASPTLPRRDRVTPLMLASDRGLADVVRALIGRGADINAVDKEGHGALFRATRRGESRAEIAVILHAAGANPDT